jgi:hypothetical protein
VIRQNSFILKFMIFFLFIIFLNLFVVVSRVPCTSYLVMRVSLKADKNLGSFWEIAHCASVLLWASEHSIKMRECVKMKRLRVKFAPTNVDFFNKRTITHAKVWFQLARVWFPRRERDFNTHECDLDNARLVI